jgi:hypothetical protein
VTLDVLSRNDFDVPGVTRDPSTVTLIDTGVGIMPVVVPLVMDTVKQPSFTQGSVVALQVRGCHVFPIALLGGCDAEAGRLGGCGAPAPSARSCWRQQGPLYPLPFITHTRPSYSLSTSPVHCPVRPWVTAGVAPAVWPQQSWPGPLCQVAARGCHGTEAPVQLLTRAYPCRPALLRPCTQWVSPNPDLCPCLCFYLCLRLCLCWCLSQSRFAVPYHANFHDVAHFAPSC